MRPSSSRSSRRSFSAFGHNWIRVVAVLVLSMSVVAGGFPVDSSANATRSAEASREARESSPGIAGWFGFGQDPGGDDEVPGPVDGEPPGSGDIDREVSRFEQCLPQIVMYQGEAYTVRPTPVDARGAIVQGATLRWSIPDIAIATVSSDGEIFAEAPGTTTLTVSCGFATVSYTLVVREGRRPQLTDDEWIRDQPVACATVATEGEKLAGSGEYIDGNLTDSTFSEEITYASNSVGSPLHDPQHTEPGGAHKLKKNLGSDNFQFVAPVLGLPGRDIDLGLALSYNSRPWSKDESTTPDTMTFNYGKGWPAVGWRIGYGRLVPAYEGGTKDNYLLIEGDGTRVHLQKDVSDPFNPYWKSTNGTEIELRNISGSLRLRYPDGTRVSYEYENNRYLPKTIRTTNGNLLTITYLAHPSASTFRWAIDTVADTVGRVVQFNYNVNAQGKKEALLSITAPDYAGGPAETIVELDYTNLTLGHNFGTMTVTGLPNPVGGQYIVSVLTAIRYPQTNRGYGFTYNSYAQMSAISSRVNMTVASATSGSEVASTTLTYNTSGVQSDAPRYTPRVDTWKTTSESSSTLTTVSASYVYTKTGGVGADTVDTVDYPDSLNVKTYTGSDSMLPDFGRVKIVELLNGSTVLQRTTYTYDVPFGTPEVTAVQVETMKDDGSAAQTRKTTYEYWPTYGRVKYAREFSGGTVARQTYFEYQDGTGYNDDNHIVDRVTKVEVQDGNPNGAGTVRARTTYLYDDYLNVKGGLENYGITSSASPDFPPGFNDSFLSLTTNLKRGNVVRVKAWIDIGANTFITRDSKYDVFGNVVEADVSCCLVKKWGFTKASQTGQIMYSQPATVTDGSGTPSLQTGYGYDLNTGLVTRMTDIRNKNTTIVYDDLSWRPTTITRPTVAPQVDETDFTYFDGSASALPSMLESREYTDGGSSKFVASKSWYDGAGRPIAGGTGAGASPTLFDTVFQKYDTSGRPTHSSNPYTSDATAVESPTSQTIWFSVTSYDALSRARTLTLPDSQTIQTLYEGSEAMEVTDPAGRRRRSEYDKLGRMIKVVEHNTSGTFSAIDSAWTTTYGYDQLDNLTGVTQGGQSRTYVFDALSRLKTETTPEGGTVNYLLEDFGSVRKMTDARNVETHYLYDALNRPTKIWYTGSGGNDSGTIRPALPGTVAATPDVDLVYFTSGDGKGQISSITNGGGLEEFLYDAIGRVSQRKWTVTGGTLRTTTYSYNGADQLATMNYPAPSSKQLAWTYDSRGRVSGLDRTNPTTLKYLSAVVYSPAGQVTSLKIGPSANNLTETFAYSADRLQLTSQTVTKGSTLMSLTYDYTSAVGELGATLPENRNNGQLLGISGTLNGASAAQTFTYDTLGRLVTATGQGSAGNDTVGAYAPSTAVWNLRNSNSGGPADIPAFGYGAGGSGFLPISGDWDGDGDDTVGLYDPATGNFFLRNTNSAGGADLTFQFGAGGGIPVAGDWNGDGVDTIGFYTSSNQTFYLRNSNTAGPADVTPFSFGASNTWKPITGDWDGDGDDTIGSFDPATNYFYLRNTNSAGGADITPFTFGTGGGTPLAGDWNGDGVDTIGYRTSGGTFNLRNSNTPGAADVTPFTFSLSSDIPIMGDWDGLGSGGASWQRRYGYDRWANRTSVHDATIGGNQIQSVGIAGGTSTPTNRITTVTEGVQNFAYQYDAVGNVTGDGVHTYKYDAANRLAEVDGGTTATYSYDAINRRVKTVALGVTTYTVWNGMHPIMEIDSTGALVEDYVYSGARLLATERGGTTYFHHQDRLSTRLLTNSTGTVVGTSSHLPYGEDGLQTGVESRHKFTTYDRDGETDLDYAMNRHSSSSTGRFLQPDIVGGSPSAPQSFNRFAYSTLDPINSTDALGLWPHGIIPLLGGGFAVSVVGPEGVGSYLDTFLVPITEGEPRPQDAGATGAGAKLAKAVADAKERLKNDICAKYIAGDSGQFAIDVLNGQESNDMLRAKPTETDPEPDSETNPARAGTGLGSIAPIAFYQPFFSDSKAEVAPGRSSLDADEARVFVLLHELRHVVSGIHHDDNDKTRPTYQERAKYNEGLEKACFAKPKAPAKK